MISFTLTLTAYPVALSFSAIEDMEYLVGNSAVTQTLQPCTTDYLGPTSITHSMRLTDLTPFPTNGMSFSSSTLTVSVQTIDQNNDGLYNVELVCSESVNSVVRTVPFTIEIFYITLIPPPTLATTLSYTV